MSHSRAWTAASSLHTLGPRLARGVIGDGDKAEAAGRGFTQAAGRAEGLRKRSSGAPFCYTPPEPDEAWPSPRIIPGDPRLLVLQIPHFAEGKQRLVT